MCVNQVVRFFKQNVTWKKKIFKSWTGKSEATVVVEVVEVVWRSSASLLVVDRQSRRFAEQGSMLLGYVQPSCFLLGAWSAGKLKTSQYLDFFFFCVGMLSVHKAAYWFLHENPMKGVCSFQSRSPFLVLKLVFHRTMNYLTTQMNNKTSFENTTMKGLL